ncbi:MAG: metallophosphoesterase [Clostridia bacterium]|nr:metallophosphoesterase [Clostridia bacterium]
MLRFLIISDTHGLREPMRELYDLYPNDGIIHLGDHIDDARWMMQYTAGHPVYQVRGNCDFGAQGPEDQLLELGGVKVLMMHGHRFGVKSGYGGALAEAKRRGADVLLFGHTHIPFLEEREGILMMNPGSLRNPNRDYGIIEIENGKAKGALLHQYD